MNWKHNKKEIVFIAIYGSQNYGLDTQESDKDYKAFTLPTFDEVYRGKMSSSVVENMQGQIEFHDIRKLPMLLKKSNPAYLEILGSREIRINPKYKQFVDYIYRDDRRMKLSKMNHSGLFDALIGMATMKVKAMEKNLPSQPSNEGYKRRIKYGFDTKQLMHAERLCGIAEKVFMWDKSYLHAIQEDAPNNRQCLNSRERLLGIKKNADNLSKEEAIRRGMDCVNSMKAWRVIWKEDQHKKQVDQPEDTFNNLEDKIKELVLKSIVEQGNK